MITPAYVRTMAAYNAEMNRRLYAAAARLPDETRKKPQGAFWSSIHGTLAHLLWGDQQWMSRLAAWPKPTVALKDSATIEPDFDKLHALRIKADAGMEDWANTVTQDWLDGDLSWYSGAAQRDLVRPRSQIIMHIFNHQTHHRGQAHALITASGESTEDTDLFLMIESGHVPDLLKETH